MTYRNRNFYTESPRRGVTLLLVLGLMTMFAMLVVTFMVVTTQAMKTSESVAKVALRHTGRANLDSIGALGKPIPTPDFDLAVDSLLVGGLNTVIGPHSILENLYGHPNYIKSDGTETQMFEDTVAAAPENGLVKVTLSFGDTIDAATYDYVGSVLTLKDADSPKSTVIVRAELDFDNSELIMHVAPFEGMSVGDSDDIFQQAIADGTPCFVNTPAFGGTGPGYFRDDSYSAGDPLLALRDGDLDNDGGFSSASSGNGFTLALRPNVLAPENDGTQKYKKYFENNLVLVNPDYTAPDYQNMFLAWNELTGSAGSYYIDSVIPSFHRPSLVRYWFGDDPSDVKVEDLRKVVLRPLRSDHPKFTGSNPTTGTDKPNGGKAPQDEVEFLMNGPWDVDTDGDGIQDGVWLDLGAAPQQIDGALYKPLYVFYVLDMDGRLNVNTHGIWDPGHNPTYSGNEQRDFGSLTDVKGSGAGVAEIRLADGLHHASGATVKIEDLLIGKRVNDEDKTGRYTKSGGTAGDETNSIPGSASDDATIDNMERTLQETLGVWHMAYATPKDSTGNGSYTGYGGLLPDFWGVSALLFDPLGNRKFDLDSNGPFFAGNPYMMNPFYKDKNASTDDSPFKGDDLEFLLRSVGDKNFHEVLSKTRLRYLIDSSNDNANNVQTFSKYRHFVTVQSTDIPTSPRSGLDGYKGIFEYLLSPSVFDGDETKTKELANLLPPEVLRGEKVSLDRIMFLEASVTDKDKLLQEKSRFAQEMFYLIMVLCHNDISASKDIARVAQWCVNLVDFLDADDVMTPFVFHETDPLNNAFDFATTVPGFAAPVSGSGQRLIWGMEQPEVALTKTFATYNRRVADSMHGHKKDGSAPAIDRKLHTHQDEDEDPKACGRHFNRIAQSCQCCPDAGDTCDECNDYSHDESFDQVMIPQGSLFLELHRVGNPHRTYYSRGGADNLYDSTNGKLDLAKKTVDGGNPVWRLAISEIAKDAPGPSNDDNDLFTGAVGAPDTYDFQPGSSTCKVTLERFIWFNDPSVATTGIPAEALGCSYFNFGTPASGSAVNANVTLAPNECLVIGPRVFTSFLSQKVDPLNPTFGRSNGDEDTQLDLASLTTTNSALKVMVAAAPLQNNGTGDDFDTDWNNVCSLGTGITDPGIGVSASEPLPNVAKYYSAVPNVGGSYVHDENGSLSVKAACNDVKDFKDKVDFKSGFGTITRYKSIFLQRLADPGRAYNATTNPYITVDWNMIDLHVFNSEFDSEGVREEEEPDLDFPPVAANPNLYFTMRQWGYTATNRHPTDRPNIWDRSFDTAEVNNETDGAGLLVKNPKTDARFTGKSEPKYLEDMKLGKPTHQDDGIERISNIYIEDPDSGDVAELPMTTDPDYADPNDPDSGKVPKYAYLHFPWNNGPISNTYELMLVPACSPSRFGFEFVAQPDPTSGGGSPHIANEWWKNVDSLGTGHMPICNQQCMVGPYFNFFKTDGGAGSPNLARLFDFVRVPSKFNGSIQGIAQDSLSGTDTWERPVYRMREPGKINLNTANEAAWEALRMDATNFPDYNTDLRKTMLGVDFNNPNTGLPTMFPTPFRSSISGALVPPLETSGQEKDLVQVNSESTLLNKNKSGPSIAPNDPVSRFDDPDNKGTNQLTALEDVMRRSDMLTNRSNVFAVWVTIGYFEVEKFNNFTDLQNAYKDSNNNTILGHINANNFDVIYPGGYVLGQEKGIGDGSVTRHRYFYLIDRSVPVGFRRGNTELNHKDVIIHSRQLE